MLDDGTVAFHLPIERSLRYLVEAETKNINTKCITTLKTRNIVHYSGKARRVAPLYSIGQSSIELVPCFISQGPSRGVAR